MKSVIFSAFFLCVGVRLGRLQPTTTTSKIKVCIQIEFLTTDKNNELPTAPQPITLQVPNSSTAHDLLIEAAKKHPVTHAFKTKSYSFGHMLTSLAGVDQDTVNNKYWMMYSDPTTLTTTGIDGYKPRNGSCVIFKYKKLSL